MHGVGEHAAKFGHEFLKTLQYVRGGASYSGSISRPMFLGKSFALEAFRRPRKAGRGSGGVSQQVGYFNGVEIAFFSPPRSALPALLFTFM